MRTRKKAQRNAKNPTPPNTSALEVDSGGVVHRDISSPYAALTMPCGHGTHRGALPSSSIRYVCGGQTHERSLVALEVRFANVSMHEQNIEPEALRWFNFFEHSPEHVVDLRERDDP